MTIVKAFSLNILELSEKIKAFKESTQEVEVKPTIRSTIFSLGSDPRVSSIQLSTPDLFLAEILRDSLNQLLKLKIPVGLLKLKYKVLSKNLLSKQNYAAYKMYNYLLPKPPKHSSS